MKPKILTVDDSKTIRLIVAKAFKPYDCDVLEAANGVEGLAVAAREHPDLIILDLTMPIMDGAEMLAKLKAQPELKAIPVIMLTAEAGRETVLRIAKLGVRDYLVKPFKEEVLTDRVNRVVSLQPKSEGAVAVKRYDDPLKILVVDDKPTIHDQVKLGLAATPWTVQGRVSAGEAVDFCNQNPPDAVLVSLTLPEGAAFSLFQMLRTNVKTKHTPVFALSVRTALEEQGRAQQAGFTAIVTKPMDFEDLKIKVTRALHLDTSYKYFEERAGVLVVKLPEQFNNYVANEVLTHLRGKVSDAVDAGLDKVVLDLSSLKSADMELVKLGINVLQVCEELSLKQRIIGGDVVYQECKKYEETKDWSFASSFECAVSEWNGQRLAA